MASSRNLTQNSPHIPQRSKEEIRNPFLSKEESSSLESNPSWEAQTSNDDYGKPFTNYSLYSQNNATDAHLMADSPALSKENSFTKTRKFPPLKSDPFSTLSTPSAYNRYPSLAESRDTSSTSLNNLINGFPKNIDNRNIEDLPLMASEDSSERDIFLSVEDSPFGGYPATSFPLYVEDKEPDDYLHNPDPIADAEYDKHRFLNDIKSIDRRSLAGFFGFATLVLGTLCLFVLLPVLTYTGITAHYSPETHEVLTRYKYPTLAAIRTSLIDPDTPTEFYTKEAKDGSLWSLVFSDEFNAEGRTFYDGDDQFWTAPDLNYAATTDLEWYDPDAVITSKGTLNLRFDAFKNHDLFYRSGMLQSWNKMCFTQGRLEVSARLPDTGYISGLWPGIWTMGNLGRPGYLATTEGVWPYTYEACDAGITPNQSSADGHSYLPGQKLNSCTCKGEDHPNRGVGRGAPEIDALEASIDTQMMVGVASQSFQIAPFDLWYMPDYTFMERHNTSLTVMNSYAGGPFQEAVSAVTTLNTSWYERGADIHNFQTYSFEYLNDNDDGYIRWFVGDNPTMTAHAYAFAPNGNIDFRRISKEPMSIVMNLGVSNSWAYIDWPSLHLPATMRIDYVRVYQPNDSISLTCDPAGHPTYNYIQEHLNAYSDFNLTSWEKAGYSYPKNSLVDKCS